jgi:hypothetical protein
MQSALEAMGLLEDSAVALTNPSDGAVEGTSPSATDWTRGDTRSQSEQPAALDDRPRQAANGPSATGSMTFRRGSRSASTIHEIVRAATARHVVRQQRARQAATTATTEAQAGVALMLLCPGALLPSALSRCSILGSILWQTSQLVTVPEFVNIFPGKEGRNFSTCCPVPARTLLLQSQKHDNPSHCAFH